LIFLFCLCWAFAPVAYIDLSGDDTPSFYPGTFLSKKEIFARPIRNDFIADSFPTAELFHGIVRISMHWNWIEEVPESFGTEDEKAMNFLTYKKNIVWCVLRFIEVNKVN
jgi:hypothetical protein